MRKVIGCILFFRIPRCLMKYYLYVLALTQLPQTHRRIICNNFNCYYYLWSELMPKEELVYNAGRRRFSFQASVQPLIQNATRELLTRGELFHVNVRWVTSAPISLRGGRPSNIDPSPDLWFWWVHYCCVSHQSVLMERIQINVVLNAVQPR